MADFSKSMKDSYDIPGERITVSNGGPKGYVYIDFDSTGRDVRTRIGLKGKRLRKFIKALLDAERS